MKYMETLLTQFRIEDVRNNYSAIMHLGLQILKAEDEPDKELLKKLEWIKDNTSPRLNTNYFTIVQTIARKIFMPLQSPIEVKVSPRRTADFELGELIAEIEEAHIKINEIIREVAKKYSIDIAFGGKGTESIIPDISMEKK